MKRALRLERGGDLEAAAREYGRAIALGSGDATAYFRRACVERRRGDLEAAEADLTRAIAADPRSARAHLARGQVRLLRKDYSGSAQDFSRAIALDPEAAEAYLGRAAARERGGDYGLALADLDTAIALDPYCAPAFLLRGSLRFEEEEWAGARDDFGRAACLEPGNAIAFYNCGVACERLGDLHGAIANYETAANMSPEVGAEHNIARRLTICRDRLTAQGEAAARPESFDRPSAVPAGLLPEWPEASIEGSGVAERTVARILDGARGVPGLGSLVIVRRGRLVAESYFDGRGRHDIRPLCSATKSVLALLVGIAMREGAVSGLNQPVPVLSEPGGAAARDKIMTFGGLLTAGAGADWEESAGGEVSISLRTSEPPDLGDGPGTDYTVDLIGLQAYIEDMMRARMGTELSARSWATDRLSIALARSTGLTTLELSDHHLFRPLGIIKRRWEPLEGGEGHGSLHLLLRPRDMAKLGQLVLQKGVAAGREIVPSAWVEECLKPHDLVQGRRYGYLWRLERDRTGPTFIAGGYGGQFIVVSPGQDLVVVTTGVLDPGATPRKLQRQAAAILRFIRRGVMAEF